IGRSVSAEGRSRANVGGRAAPVGALTELAEHLVVVHGQSEQLRLRSAAAQRDALDRFAGSALLQRTAKFRDSFRQARQLEQELAELTANRDALEREAAQLRADVDEIEALQPQPGELDELARRIERLSNTEELRRAASVAHDALSSEELDGADVLALLESARRTLERTADSELEPLAAQLSELSFIARDVAGALARFVSNLDESGPADLDSLNERRAALTALVRKFCGEDGLDGVFAYAERASARLLQVDTSDEHTAALHATLGELRSRVRVLATELSAARAAAAGELAAAVTEELHALALPDAQLVVEVNSADLGEADAALPSTLTESGADTVTLLLAPHPGSQPRPIAKSASGGELSRVMLALEVVISANDPVPTFVFDEVDAGVGGAAAIEIGRRLARLAQHAQVIVVTHLAQVAAFADNHLRVLKANDGSVTASSVERLHGDAREAEMARLLSGLAESESGLAHARELLALSR
ncbi:MAG: DNA repair protein RecN, partial [Agromyces sp.]